jgi:hypothetical protein
MPCNAAKMAGFTRHRETAQHDRARAQFLTPHLALIRASKQIQCHASLLT